MKEGRRSEADIATVMYGEAVKEWKGSGQLELNQGDVPCSFELAQIGNGRIVISSEVEGWTHFINATGRLVGRVDGSLDVTVNHLRVNKQMARSENGGPQTTSLVVNGSEYEVKARDEAPVAFRYGLTNLTFIGNDGYVTPAGGRGRQARFALDGFDVVVREVEGARELADEAQAIRGIRVTAYAQVSGGSEDRERIDATLQRLCLLLTLAQGRRVEWIYREGLDREGSVVQVYGRNAVTKPWGGLELIPEWEVCRFIGTTYPSFSTMAEPWGLEKAILSYNDAKLEGDYLEFRSLKMAVAVEYLKGRYLEARGKPASFRNAASGMCSSLGVPLSADELRLLVKVRNSLVHEATFWSGPGAPPRFEQYTFLMSVVGRVLLAVLRYRGEWYDWRGASRGTGPQRVGFELGPAT